MERKDVYEVMQNDIMKSDISETEKNKMLKNVMRLKEQKMNIMIKGAMGFGNRQINNYNEMWEDDDDLFEDDEEENDEKIVSITIGDIKFDNLFDEY